MDGQFEGRGTYKFPDGTYVEGQWKRNRCVVMAQSLWNMAIPLSIIRLTGEGKVKDQDGHVWHGDLHADNSGPLQLEVLPLRYD